MAAKQPKKTDKRTTLLMREITLGFLTDNFKEFEKRMKDLSNEDYTSTYIKLLTHCVPKAEPINEDGDTNREITVNIVRPPKIDDDED